MNFAIYCRKSKYTGRGESIDTQIEYCTKYIELSFNNVDELNIRIYSDEGYSGKDLERPSFRMMMRDCYSHIIDYVVVYRLDRISRNVSDFANLYQTLLDLNIGFISTSEKYDTSTSGGRAMLFMACVFAQLERETLSERVRDNMYSLAKTGRWLGGITPTGYSSELRSINGRFRYILIPNDQLSTVELIYSRYLETMNVSDVVNHLHNVGIKSPRGNEYSGSSIKTILQNPVYCKSDATSLEYLTQLGSIISCTLENCNGNGYMVYGRTSVQGRKVQKRVSARHWVVSIGEHNGIVSGDQWVSIQLHMHNKDYRSRIIHNSNSLLSGKLFCPICGSKMIPRTKKNGFSYACSNKLRYGTKVCNSKNVDGSIDTILISKILNEVTPNCNAVPLLQELKKSIHTLRTDTLASVSFNLEPSKSLIDRFNDLPIHIKRRFLNSFHFNITMNLPCSRWRVSLTRTD